MAGHPIFVDSANWPVVVSVFDGPQTEADIDRYITTVDAVYARREPFVTVSLMRRWSASATQLNRVAQWMTATEPLVRAYCVCTGIVTHSPGFRFLLSSLFLLRPMPVPYRVCATLEDALAFARGEGARRGLRVPRTLDLPAAVLRGTPD